MEVIIKGFNCKELTKMKFYLKLIATIRLLAIPIYCICLTQIFGDVVLEKFFSSYKPSYAMLVLYFYFLAFGILALTAFFAMIKLWFRPQTADIKMLKRMLSSMEDGVFLAICLLGIYMLYEIRELYQLNKPTGSSNYLFFLQSLSKIIFGFPVLFLTSFLEGAIKKIDDLLYLMESEDNATRQMPLKKLETPIV